LAVSLILAKMTAVITRQGVYIKKSDFKDKAEIGKLTRYFTKKVMGFKNRVTSRSLIKKNSTHIIFPRFGILDLIKRGKHTFKVRNAVKENKKIEFTRAGEYWNNQELVVNTVMKDYFNEDMKNAGLASVIVQMPTGQGKSRMAAALVGILNCKTLVIPTMSTIADDWRTKVFVQEFPGVTIGQQYGGTHTDGDIVVGLVQTLLKPEVKVQIGVRPKKYKIMKSSEYFKQFDFIIFDETQLFAAKTFLKIFFKTCAPYVLGLSATPEGTDYHKLISYGIGPVLNSETLAGYKRTMDDWTVDVHMIKYKANAQFSRMILNKKDELNYAATINMVCEDPFRKRFCADFISRLSVYDYNSLCFSGRKAYSKGMGKLISGNQKRRTAHALSIFDKFPKKIRKKLHKFAYKNYCMTVVGGAKEAEFKEVEEKANIVFTTYQYMGVGKSINKLNAIVLCTPMKKNTKQTIGRILRSGSDSSVKRIVVDVVDFKLSLKNQWYTRKKFYTAQGYKIHTHEVSYLDYCPNTPGQWVVDADTGTGKKSKTKSKKSKPNALIQEMLRLSRA
jgi:hypothetical protein